MSYRTNEIAWVLLCVLSIAVGYAAGYMSGIADVAAFLHDEPIPNQRWIWKWQLGKPVK